MYGTMRRSLLIVLVGLSGYLVGAVAPPPPLLAQAGDEQCFPETKQCIRGAFLRYWLANGGLRQQGLPISAEIDEQQPPPPIGDGKTHRVQYFERARFEHHAEFSGTPNEVLLGRIGAEQYAAKYQTPPPQDPFTIADVGSKNTAAFSLAGGAYKSTWQAIDADGSRAFGCFHGARLTPETGGIGESLGSSQVDANATLTGETFLYNVKPGRYYIDANSTCRWSITIAQQR